MNGRRLDVRRPAFWIWTGVVGVAVAVLLVGLLWVTGEPDFCRTCHEMRPQVDGWRAGTHKDVSCFACHSSPGLAGYLKAHIVDGGRDLWVHFTRWPSRITPSGPMIVPPPRCLACHGSQPRGKAPAFPSAQEFPSHPPKDANCDECHRDSIHGPKP